MNITVAATAAAFGPYPTPGGGHVILGDHGEGVRWRYTSRCTGAGCSHKDAYRNIDTAHRHAQAHAKNCYNQPAEDGATPSPAAQLPTTPGALADRILTVGDAGLLADLTAQIGGQRARHLLAQAHSIVAERLWNS